MHVGAWLHDLGLGQYEQAFRDNDIDAGLLPTLTADDLRELGVASLAHRKRLLAAIAELGSPDQATAFGRGTGAYATARPDGFAYHCNGGTLTPALAPMRFTLRS